MSNTPFRSTNDIGCDEATIRELVSEELARNVDPNNFPLLLIQINHAQMREDENLLGKGTPVWVPGEISGLL